MTERPVTVFDCGVFLQGLLSKTGPAARCLELIDEDGIRLVMSQVILMEIKDVLSRDSIQNLSPHLTAEKLDGLIGLIYEKAEFVEDVPHYFSYPRDPSDEPYLNLAIHTKATFLVARDRDLLDLMTDYTDEAKEFRQKFRNLKIVGPNKFLKLISEMALEP